MKNASPLPVILITMGDANEASRAIQNGIFVNGSCVAPEKYVPKKRPLQCFNCQNFNHASNICTKPPACMKCSGSHPSKQCSVTIIKCVNCGEAHKANSPDCSKFPVAQKNNTFLYQSH